MKLVYRRANAKKWKEEKKGLKKGEENDEVGQKGRGIKRKWRKKREMSDRSAKESGRKRKQKGMEKGKIMKENEQMRNEKGMEKKKNEQNRRNKDGEKDKEYKKD